MYVVEPSSRRKRAVGGAGKLTLGDVPASNVGRHVIMKLESHLTFYGDTMFFPSMYKLRGYTLEIDPEISMSLSWK